MCTAFLRTSKPVSATRHFAGCNRASGKEKSRPTAILWACLTLKRVCYSWNKTYLNVDYKDIADSLQKDLLEKIKEAEKLQDEVDRLKSESRYMNDELKRYVIIDSLDKIQLLEENKILKKENEQLKKENEHLDHENDLQAEHYVQLKEENERLEKITQIYSLHSPIPEDSEKEEFYKSIVTKNLRKFVEYTDFTTLTSFLKLLTSDEYDELEMVTHDKKDDVVRRRTTRQISEGVSLHNMKLIAEYHTEFSSDKPLSLDWDKYGCRLQIPQGSIPQGEVGTLDLYAIYNGPFQFPQDSSPVSAYYFISLSHDLQKPAVLELQHCYIINNHDNAAQLTFASATDSTDPPYRFRAVDGGSFLPDRYALIHQNSFSFFSIIWQWARESVSRLVYGVQPGEETETMEEDPPCGSNCSYAVLYFLIPVQSPVLWHVKLFITKYINPHFEYFKQELERKEPSVDMDWQTFSLKEGVNTVSITVLPEEGTNEDQKVELKRWNGTRRVLERNWAIIGRGTEVCISSVLENLSYPIKIHVVWTSELPPKMCVFRIHLLGVEGEISFPVIIVPPYRYQPGSLCPSPRRPKLDSTHLPDILRATNEVSDWFRLGIFLKVDYSKLKTLEKDYPSDHNHCRQEMLMFWISSGNATWSVLVETLRNDMNEPGLAERIGETYIQ